MTPAHESLFWQAATWCVLVASIAVIVGAAFALATWLAEDDDREEVPTRDVGDELRGVATFPDERPDDLLPLHSTRTTYDAPRRIAADARRRAQLDLVRRRGFKVNDHQ